MTTTKDEPGVRFYHVNDVPWKEAIPQMHGERRVAAHLKILEWNKDRMVSYTKYDPGLILRRHGHKSDSHIFIIEGDVTIGGRPCPTGTLIVLDKDTFFGPLVAGPNGCVFLESYGTDIGSIHESDEEYEQLLSKNGVQQVEFKNFDPPKSS